MLVVAIRQAEVAIQENRLDDAFVIACRKDVRDHARGQNLVSRLVDCLIHRAYEHFFEDRLDEAHRDCEKAHQLGGDQVEIGRLRSCIDEERDERRKLADQRRRELDTARRKLQGGELTAVERICDLLPTDDQLALRAENRTTAASTEDCI